MSNIYISEPQTKGKVVINTTYGELDIELWSKETPLACKNFLQHAVNGYYDGCIFHKVVKGFMVQTGDPSNTGDGGDSTSGMPFKDEYHQRLKFCRRGLCAMANTGPNTNKSQFFITLDRCDTLNRKHTIFGKVTGETIYNLVNIGEVEVDENERPINDIVIKSIEILNDPFDCVSSRVEIKETPKEESIKITSKGTKDKKLLSFELEESENVLIVKKEPFKKKLLEETTLINFSDETQNSIQPKNAKNENIEFESSVGEEVIGTNQSKVIDTTTNQSEAIDIVQSQDSSEPKLLMNVNKKKDFGDKYLSKQRRLHKQGKNQKLEQNKKASELLESFKRKLETETNSWLNHKLEFERDEDPVVALNLGKEKIEDRYDLHDPRNPLNKRRRENNNNRMEAREKRLNKL